MTPTIRAAAAADAASVGRLARQFAVYLRSLGDTGDLRFTAGTYLRDGFGANPSFAGLVAVVDGDVMGYLLYHFGYDTDCAARILHIVDLYVDLNARNRGIGRSLMTAATRVARDGGAKEIVWAVYHANTSATAFYERLGAQKIRDLFFMRLYSDCE